MTYLSIPIAVLYAGLAGVVLALLVATYQNNWSCRVFFLLTLRLAIGWHFLFEGLHKVHSHYAGPTETTRPFSSEPYFKVAPGPIGERMRRTFNDPSAVIEAKVKPAREITPEAFARLSAEEQAAACPPAVAQELDALEQSAQELIKTEAHTDRMAANAAEKKELEAAKTDDDRAKAKAKAEAARQEAQKKEDSFKEAAPHLITAAKAKYARWVYGVEGRDAKVKFVTGDVPLTAPQRLAHLDWMRQQVKAEEDRQSVGLGQGYGIDTKKASEMRTELIAAEADLAKDAEAFVAELKKGLGGTASDAPAPTSLGQRMDKVTMWFLVAVGSLLLAGLFTRVACVLGAGFLVMTYLAHPPFPWYPLPPNTEGNPLFVNKNVIEALALLTLACYPTGRWLGLDALVSRCCARRNDAAETAA